MSLQHFAAVSLSMLAFGEPSHAVVYLKVLEIRASMEQAMRRERERVAGMESWYSGSTTTVKAYLEAHATWSVRVGESIRRIPGISRRHPRDQLDHQATTGNQDTARTPAKMFAPVY